jgi:hypothetical protein
MAKIGLCWSESRQAAAKRRRAPFGRVAATGNAIIGQFEPEKDSSDYEKWFSYCAASFHTRWISMMRLLNVDS